MKGKRGERYICVCVCYPPADITNKQLIKCHQQIVQIAHSLVTLSIYALMLWLLLPTAENAKLGHCTFNPHCLQKLFLFYSHLLLSHVPFFPSFTSESPSLWLPALLPTPASVSIISHVLSNTTSAHLYVYVQYSQTDLPTVSTREFTLKVVIKDKHTHIHTKPQLMRDAVSTI